MKNKFKIIVILIMLSFTLCMMSSTYSRYVANTSGDVEALFSKWQILVNTNDITSNSNSSFELIPVIEENENVKKNTIAPSSKGYFDIEIDPSLVEVSFNYDITFSIQNENISDLIISKYAILDKDYIEGDSLEYNILSENKITGEKLYNIHEENFSFDKFTIRIFFEWYDGENENMTDEDDTLAANENKSFNINANIHFSQKLN